MPPLSMCATDARSTITVPLAGAGDLQDGSFELLARPPHISESSGVRIRCPPRVS
jgi:hypothetical protein